MTEPTTAATPLQVDLPCAKCGYDLRGLAPPGKCPECGYDIGHSIRASRAGPARAPPADPRWLGEMATANTVALLCLVLAVAVGAALSNKPFDAPGMLEARYIAAAVQWVLSGYAAWKIAPLEPLEQGDGWRRIVAVGCRGFTTAWLLTVSFAILISLWDARTLRTEALQAGVAGLSAAAAACYYLRTRHVAARLGAAGLAGQALTLAIVSPAGTGLLATAAPDGLLAFTPLTGASTYVGVALNRLVRDSEGWGQLAWLTSWPFLLMICQVALLVQVRVVLVRARRRLAIEPTP